MTCWALGLLSPGGVGFWDLWQNSYFRGSLALSKVHGVAERSGTYSHVQEGQPCGPCILSGAGQWPGECPFLPKEKPRVKVCSSSLAAWGCRECGIEPQDRDLLPDPGRAPQLFRDMGRPLPILPLLRVL